MISILKMEIRLEEDLVFARHRARQIAELLGLDSLSQTRIATAVSEIARNAFRYAESAKAIFSLDLCSPQTFWISIEDKGPGIENLPQILKGQYQSQTGMGLGLTGARRLMDHFEIDSIPGHGTKVRLGKALAVKAKVLSAQDLGLIAEQLLRYAPKDTFYELKQQNSELLQALATLAKREQELAGLNRELADTNRGVIALNYELEEKALAVREASSAKSNFLAQMTHEFRTPVNSILSLTRILSSSDSHDGELSLERQKQVGFIRRAAETLSELINDILDTARADAGRLDMHLKEVNVGEVFGALRAMFKPLLLVDKKVQLTFIDPPPDFPNFFSDEGKFAQIMRNFVSNALKYTDEGFIQVEANLLADGQLRFVVQDSGIGIEESNLTRIFEDFTQIPSAHQRQNKGTGLGLPLARRLAEFLGGSVLVESSYGQGSTFTLNLPLVPPDVVAGDLEKLYAARK